MIDRLLIGDVWTMASPARAQAILVRAGKIAAVGAAKPLVAQCPQARVDHFDRITPGLHDAHVHPAALGRSAIQLSLAGLTDPLEVADRVQQRAATTPPGEWIAGGGYVFDEPPDRNLLDDAAPEHPVFLRCRDLHSGWVNGRALELAQLTDRTADPPDGRLLRDDAGRLTGVLLEQAVEPVRGLLPPLDRSDWLRGLEALARAGYTAAHSMAAGPREAIVWAEQLAADQALPLRLYFALDPEQLDDVEPGFRGEQLDVAAVKLFADGALGSQTAWMRRPYADGRTGWPADRPERIRQIGERALRAGFTVAVHAIGDRAVATVVSLLGEMAPKATKPLRIEHAQHVPDDVLPRLVEPLALSMQPLHLPGDVPLIEKLLPDRAREAFRFADLVATGIPVAFGSDAPVVAPDAMAAVEVATAHCLQATQSLTEQQALTAFSRDAARAAGWQDCGTVAAGQRADLTLWQGGRIAGRLFEGRLERRGPPDEIP